MIKQIENMAVIKMAIIPIIALLILNKNSIPALSPFFSSK